MCASVEFGVCEFHVGVDRGAQGRGGPAAGGGAVGLRGGVRAVGPGQRLLQLAPVAFDASTLEIWGALLTGATMVIAPPGPFGLTDIAALLRDGGVTVAWLTAGLFHQLAETDIDAIAACRSCWPVVTR